MTQTPDEPLNAAEADPTVPAGANPDGSGTGAAVPSADEAVTEERPGTGDEDGEVEVGLGPST